MPRMPYGLQRRKISYDSVKIAAPSFVAVHANKTPEKCRKSALLLLPKAGAECLAEMDRRSKPLHRPFVIGGAFFTPHFLQSVYNPA